jgi:hypothetical protein
VDREHRVKVVDEWGAAPRHNGGGAAPLFGSVSTMRDALIAGRRWIPSTGTPIRSPWPTWRS